MARLLGPDMGSRFCYLASGAPAAGATAVVYANSAGTILADIAAYQPGDPGTPGGVIIGSQVITDGNGLLPLFWLPDGLDRVWVSVNGGTVSPVDADYNARLDASRTGVFNAATYGATGDGVTDDAAAIQAAIDAAAAVGGGEVRLGRGIFLCGATITWPLDTPIALRGEGRVHASGAMGTSLQRAAAFTGPLIEGLGTVSDRIIFDISDLELHGGGGSATAVRFDKVSTSRLSNVRFAFAAGTLLHATEWWNCWIEQVLFNNGGTGTATPASLFDGDCNTLHFTDCEWEANSGTDLRISGIAFSFSNPKLERGSGNYPLVDLVDAGAVQFNGGFLHLSAPATGTHIVQSGTMIPSRPNGFSNCEISGNFNSGGSPGGDALVPYFVDVQSGELLLSNVSMNGNPTTAFIHAASTLGANALRLRNVTVTDRSKLLHDERSGSVYGLGSIPLVPAVLDAGVVVEVPVNRVIWRLPDGATNRITYGNVPIPADAADGRPVRVRILWYSDGNTGAIRYTVGVRALTLTNDDITVGQTDHSANVTVPATVNRTITTTVATSVTVAPGARFVAVFLERVGADGADTCTGSMRVLGVELLYERAV